MRKVVVWLGFLFLLALIFVFSQWPDGKTHIIACDVGQGDAILVTNGFSQVLIDGGPDDSVLSCLERHLPFWDRQLELVVLTHPETDHFRGLTEVVARYWVSQLVAHNLVGKAADFERFRAAVLESGVSVHAPVAGEVVRVGDLSFLVLWPRERVGDERVWQAFDPDNSIITDQGAVVGADGEALGAYSGNLNEVATVLLLDLGEVEALFTADIGSREELALVTARVIPDIEILKVAHHGSKYSSSLDFLRVAKPEVALISVGARNTYGHPTRETLMHLEEVGAKILRTDELGDVEVVTDGERVWVESF